jgi:hypothetical protein
MMGGAKRGLTARDLERIHDEHVVDMFRHGMTRRTRGTGAGNWSAEFIPHPSGIENTRGMNSALQLT